MALRDTIAGWFAPPAVEERSGEAYPLAFQDWVNMLAFNANQYTFVNQTLPGSPQQEIGGNFTGLVAGAFKSNGIVFACVQARMLLLSQARFQFQEMRGGRPGDLFGTADLDLLEHPERGKVTADLLARASLDIDMAGNHFVARRVINGRVRLKRLRPDWVSILLGSESDTKIDQQDIDAEVVGYVYYPGGRHAGIEPEYLLPETVAHFALTPDPIASYRGMSWMTPILREIMGDGAATDHKLKFFENAATPNIAVKLNIDDLAKFNAWVDQMEASHKGSVNAYRTLYTGAGADTTVIGTNLQQLDFRNVQGAGEVRIAAASGVHPVIVGILEGLQGSSLNQGNFMAARRLVADMALRPWWGNFASSMEVIVPSPSGSRLWYDDRHIPFLAEDVKDAAEILKENMLTVESGVRAGYEQASVVDAVTSGDLKRLKHTGLFSVQLQPPGTLAPPPAAAALPDDAGRALLLEMARSSRPDPAQVTFEADSIHVETPVTVNPPAVTFEEGAIRSDNPVTVNTPDVRFEEGAIRVETPVTVEPAQLTIEEGAIRSETPVTVNTPEVTIAEGAVQVDSPVTVHPTEVTVEPAQVTVEQPPRRTVRKDVTHDEAGRITRVVETEE